MRTYTEKIKMYFYGVRLKNSKFEKIHNNTRELENHLDHLLNEYNIKFIFETIAEKIEMLKGKIEFKEYQR